MASSPNSPKAKNNKIEKNITEEMAITMIAERYSNIFPGGPGRFIIFEELIDKLDWFPAIFLSYLVNRYLYFKKHKRLVTSDKHPGEWVPLKQEFAETKLRMKRRRQDNCIEELEAKNLIEQRVFTRDPQRYFKVNLVEFAKLLASTDVEFHDGNPENAPGFQRELYEKDKSEVCKKDNLKCTKRTNRSLYNIYKIESIDIHTPIPSLTSDGVDQCDSADADPQPVSTSASTQHNINYQDSCLKTQTKADSPPESKLSYGENGFVKLTAKQYEDLLKRMTPEVRDQLIESVNNKIGELGEVKFNKDHKSHYHTLLNWLRWRQENGGVSSHSLSKKPAVDRVSVREFIKKWVLPKGVQIDILEHKIRIEGGGAQTWGEELEFGEKAFFERLESILRKRQFTKRS